MSFKSSCEKYFGTSDFYEVLCVSPDANLKTIKKAYHRMSLLVHPDRVDEDQKQIATEKFKVLGKIYTILQNEEKRKLYDDAGEFDDEMDSTFNWMEYWKKMFKKIDVAEIERYKQEYIGSVMEINDIKKAYVSSKGDLNVILEMVPFSNCESEPRIIEIVRKLVDDGELPMYKAFFNENQKKRLKRHRQWEQERKDAEKINLEELEKELEANLQRRSQGFQSFIDKLEAECKQPKKRKSITDGSADKRAARRATRSSKK